MPCYREGSPSWKTVEGIARLNPQNGIEKSDEREVMGRLAIDQEIVLGAEALLLSVAERDLSLQKPLDVGVQVAIVRHR